MTLPVPIAAAAATPVKVGRYSADSQVISAVRNAAAATGTSFDVLMTSAAMESGLQPSARASGSSAAGMFQFIEQTWLDTMRQYGASHGLQAEAAAIVNRSGRLTVDDPQARQRILDLRHDPKVSSLLAGDSLRALSDQLAKGLGRAPDVTEVYLGHFLGSGGATQMLQALKATPNQAAADILPQAASANTSMFYGSDGKALSVSQFVDKVRGRVSRAYADLGATMPQGAVLPTARTTPSRADAPDSGASGWGTGRPSRAASPPERLMLSNLAEVFTRVDRGITRAADTHKRHNAGLPGGVLQALQTTTGEAPTSD